MIRESDVDSVRESIIFNVHGILLCYVSEHLELRGIDVGCLLFHRHATYFSPAVYED